MIALGSDHAGFSLKQEIILSHILQIVKTQIYFSINTKRPDSCESAQLFKKVL